MIYDFRLLKHIKAIFSQSPNRLYIFPPNNIAAFKQKKNHGNIYSNENCKFDIEKVVQIKCSITTAPYYFFITLSYFPYFIVQSITLWHQQHLQRGYKKSRIYRNKIKRFILKNKYFNFYIMVLLNIKKIVGLSEYLLHQHYYLKEI